jgi:hypothetical protein
MTQIAKQPDILEVIADLSNDEVFTPPKMASAVLDLLPGEVWSNPDLRWLDPGTKTGVFLREVTKRLMKGLETVIPGEQVRLEHILRNQVFGSAITELTSLMARRTLYCSKTANGPKSTVKMSTPAGNVWFDRVDHLYESNGKCSECGASQEQMERDNRENYAYAFIHAAGRAALEKEFEMKFDVIVGNPPYQLDDGGHSASASPIYHHFVESAIDMDPRFVLMITPSRWFAGGKGLDTFRARMLKDRRLRFIVDYPKLYDGFPGVKIRGGVSYFLWSRDHVGPCTVQTMWDGQPLGPPVERFLDSYDVLVRRNEAVPILEKVRAFGGEGRAEPTLDQRVSKSKPFGYRTYYSGMKTPEGMTDPIKLHGNQKVSWVERSGIPQNVEWVDDWKVLMTAVQGTSAAVETIFLSKPIIAGPGEACTETYLVVARTTSEEEAALFAKYLRTRFVRFLVSLRKSTQHATNNVYAFVPDLPMDRVWTDQELYARYGITEQEQAHISETVAEMPA